MRVNRSDLGPLEEISEGGFGRVYRAPQYRLPGDPATAIAYKEFTTDVDAQARSAEKAVLFRDLMSPADRADLDRCAVWPLALVADGAAVTGLLMPLIPADFFFDTIDPFTGSNTRMLRDLQWLIANPTQLAAQKMAPVDEIDRLVLIARLVYDIGRLHKHGWVYGDLSLMNAAYALSPPRLILLDCDGAASLTDIGRKQSHSIGWKPPECAQVNIQDRETDVYKLGLAIMRFLNPGVEDISTKTDRRLIAGRLDPAGAGLVERAVGTDRSARPTAKELYAYLHAVVAARVAPPEVVAARLATPLRVRGMDARVELEIKNVPEVTIRVGANPPQTVQTNGQPQVHIVHSPQTSGPVTIEAANRYGAVRVDLGELTLYELPPFDLRDLVGTLPRLPAVPTLEAFTLGALAPALASVPRVPVPEFPKIPSVPTADLGGVIREMVLPGSDIAGTLQFPDLGALVAEPTREIADVLTDLTRQFAESQRDSYLTAAANAKDDD
jgi:serine/threonine protein kinase